VELGGGAPRRRAELLGLDDVGRGAPAAIPVWAIWIDGGVVFGTSPRSQKGRNLARDPRVVIHLESGDETVILHGSVEPVPPGLSDAATDAYNTKYAIEQQVDEGWLMLRPRRALAWREHDYPQSATRFDFR
jgi:hypothetical protein